MGIEGLPSSYLPSVVNIRLAMRNENMSSHNLAFRSNFMVRLWLYGENPSAFGRLKYAWIGNKTVSVNVVIHFTDCLIHLEAYSLNLQRCLITPAAVSLATMITIDSITSILCCANEGPEGSISI